MKLSSVIIVDDSPDDRYLARRAVGGAKLANRVVELEDGDELVPLLEDPARFLAACGEPPVLILLDINMPGRNGFEVLSDLAERFAAGDCDPRSFVVAMFTSSDNPEDRRRAMAYDFVCGYLVKPIGPAQLHAVIERGMRAAATEPCATPAEA